MNYVLPGMGATSEMFTGPWRKLANTSFLDWPVKTTAQSIPELAQEIIHAQSIQHGDSLIGTSLGGIVACEISNQIELKHLVLIASASTHQEINRLLHMLSPLAKLTPIEWFQQTVSSIDSQLTDMFAQSNPRFIRTMSQAIFKWQGLRSKVIPFRIHGTKDPVIPMPQEVDVTIEGGHLIAMTHPAECIQAISKKIL